MQQGLSPACDGAARKLTILSVGYPFAPISPDPVGGAEQVLAHIDANLVDAGHRSIVIAPEGSSVSGELWTIPSVAGEFVEAAGAAVHAELRARIQAVLSRDAPDVIHLHGIDFDRYLPERGPPVLVTLHLPLAWYRPSALMPPRADVWLHPVSGSQARTAPAGARLAAPIENGVDITPLRAKKRSFAFMLGRICPEKGFDDALEASARAGIPLLIAGTTFPYREHQAYLRDAILPRLDRRRRWIGAVAGVRKRRLLAQARCVLVPSKVPETSSIVAMEALAAGTPVIAYRAGALPDIVEHGRTGFIVDSVEAMADAIRAVGCIDPAQCRAEARRRFPLRKTIDAYLGRYRELASQ
jgi:glycosyltransferase involved in cell wall biosynthesis